jgi:hypothetical protein
MKTYVEKEDENQKISNQSQEEVFEDIDSTKENDRDDQNNQFVYNLNVNFSEICKKCDVKRKTFKSNNVFHSHLRACKNDETTINILSEQKFENVLILKCLSRIQSRRVMIFDHINILLSECKYF